MNKIGFTPPLPEMPTKKLSEGEIPYLLSRLEYFEIKFNTWIASSIKDVEGVYIDLEAHPEENTITIKMYYTKEVSETETEPLLLAISTELSRQIEKRGWDDWAKIKVISKPL